MLVKRLNLLPAETITTELIWQKTQQEVGQCYCKTVFLKEAKWLCFHKLARGILVATAGV